MTITSVAAVTTKFLFSMCNCMVDSDAGMYSFLLVLGGFAHVWAGPCEITFVSRHELHHIIFLHQYVNKIFYVFCRCW